MIPNIKNPNETQPKTQRLSVYKVYHPDFNQLKLYGGEYPGSWDKEEHPYKVKDLSSLGITTSICLMEQQELMLFSPYQEEMTKTNPAFKMLNYSIVDMSVPTKPVMVEILDKIDELIAAEERIYVHCFGGHGRSGTVIGCWLKRYGFKNQEVYLKLAYWRDQTLFGKTSSPQGAEQFAMINNWQKGE
jgi:protein-tyrosine phosphatase